MRRVGSLMALLGLVAGLAICTTAQAARAPNLIIHDVAIVDTRTGELLEDKDVVISPLELDY